MIGGISGVSYYSSCTSCCTAAKQPEIIHKKGAFTAYVNGANSEGEAPHNHSCAFSYI